MRRGGFAPLALGVALASSLVLVLGGGLARAAEGTVTCTLSVTDASGRPITTIPANTTVVLTATADFASAPTADDAAIFSDTGGLDVTGEPVHTTFDGRQITWTLATQSLIAGDHSFYFTFISSNGTDYCITDTVPLHVGAVEPTHTTTTVNLSSASIDAGQTIDITASVVQEGTQIAPPGGNVTFWSKRDGASAFIQIDGSQPLVDGQASVHNVGGWTAGRYTIEARYAGDTFQFGASQGDATLVSHGSSTVTYSSPQSATVGDTVTLQGTLTNGELQPAAGEQVSFTIVTTGDTCTGTTDADGAARCVVTVHGPAGPSDVAVAYAGDDVYGASSDTGRLTIERGPTTLTVAHASATSGGAATLSATLTTEAGAPIAGQSVVLTLTGNPTETCTATTNASGLASCSTVISEPAGSYAVLGSFAGTTDAYLPSHGDEQLDVVPAPTTLTYSGDAVAAPGGNATIAFTLTSGTTLLPNEPVTITFDGRPYDVTTDANGVAQIVVIPTGAGTHAAVATFDGDGFYATSTATQTVPSAIPTSLTYLGDTSVVSSGTATLTVELTDTLHNVPLADASVTLTLAGGETCTVRTDAAGIASCQKRVDADAGPDAITATYAGATAYLPSSTTATLNVSATRTAIALAPVVPTLRGASVHLSAFLLSTQTLRPLADKEVTLSFGSQSCTDTTNVLGLADCTIGVVTAPVGLATVTAAFAGDAGANAATDTRQAIVYALAPGDCWFVVGDRDVDGGKVNFWGAQWWKNNHLSRSSSDSSFKGFATSRAGSTWTSKPGNSSSPPNGPLPAYMAVIVSSSMSKSGSTISGDVVRVVVVRTDAGYDANPGHAGTGTVVATLP